MRISRIHARKFYQMGYKVFYKHKFGKLKKWMRKVDITTGNNFYMVKGLPTLLKIFYKSHN